MSWATEDWTLGLSGHVAQKVKELQVHQERLSRENKQKQLQIDNIYTSLEKQNAKNEEVRVELQSVQRELQMVQDEAKAAVNSRERLSQELQTKQAQVCSLEGQLDAARTLNSKLSQEVKRLEAELEKLQNSICSTDTTPFSTPCWSATSPWENNGNRKEERTGYRDEGNNQTHNSRQRLQFSDCSPQPLKNTPLRHPSDQSETFSTPLAAFPWERDDSKPATRRRSPMSSQMPCTDVIIQVHQEQGAFGKEKGLCKETDASVTALQASMAALKEELSSKAALIKSIQNEMAQSKKELAAKEISVQRARDELNLAHTRMAQENERASGAEQRLKQLQEELKCQRQNAESSRLQHQQRTKDLEKQHQRDLTELHKERQCLEKQHQQEGNKLNQELQQARTLHNGLQAQADKLSLQKQTLEKELDTLKEKQKWTEGQLQESQKKEAQTQAKLMAAVREAEGVAVSLEQSRKKERALEEEGRRLAEELADTLRLVKELQEQKAAPAPVIQPVQFCSVGQSFSSPTSQALNARLLTQIKPAVEQKRELKRRVEISSSYPSDREPGEGIDSEHIAALIPPDCDTLQREGHNRNNEEKGQNKVVHNSKSDTICSFDYDTPTSILIDQDQSSLLYSAEKAPALISDRAIVFEDIKKENAALRSELRDAHEEIQKRLDDLESQRRAEAEARTRVKQLSRKLASQSTEKKEQDEKWREKVEREKTETEKLRKTITALEMEVKKGREADEANERQEVQEDKKYKALEDRESEMVELNFQLKKQLSEVKAQLALEREEKKREEEEKTQLTNTIIDEKNELNMKLEELKAELEQLKHSTNDSEAEEKLTVSSSPLLYLTLHDDELNSNNLPSPEQHLLFCQSTNQRNTLVSQATAPLIQEQQTVIDPEVSPQVASDVPSTQQNSSVNYSAPSDLENEVERLQKENVKETERANYYQLKLEALQSQVTYQTQQLTTEFEKQSQYIVCLLAELQQKDSAFLRLEAELQHCKQEFELFKSQREKEENNMTFEGDGQPRLMGQEESSLETFGLHHSEEKQGTVTCDHDRLTPISGKETSGSDDQHARPIKVDNTQRSHDREEVEFSQGRATADLAAELPALQRDHQPLQKNISDLNNSVNDSYLTHTESKQQEQKHQDKLQNHSPISAAQPCLAEPRSPPRLHDITAKDDLQVERSCDKEQGDLEREDEGIEGELKAACDPEINRLQEQVVELHTKLRALSAVARQQAEELTLWRLTSQPPPLFDLSNTENQFVNQDQISGVNRSQSDQYQTEEGLTLGVLESHGKVTVARTDELLLSCSSNKLQGYMLNSSVEQSNIPETQSLPHLEMIQSLQKYNLNENDKESESEDLELSNSCQHKENSALQVSFERTSPQHLTRDSGPERTKLFNLESPEDTPDAPSLTSEITTKDSSDRAFRIGRRSVGSQTEDSFGPRAPPAASQLQCVYTQTTEEDDDEDVCVESPPVSPPAWGPEAGNQVLFSGSFPIPADPARLAERIRRNRTQLSAAFDDTEYEPYGLPEVVMKGFADIPSGPSCPYIVRRGLLGTTVVPVDQKIQDQEETD